MKLVTRELRGVMTLSIDFAAQKNLHARSGDKKKRHHVWSVDCLQIAEMCYVRIEKENEDSKKMKTLSNLEQDLVSYPDRPKQAKSKLTKLAVWINDRNIPFLVTSLGMIVMLLWAGAYKMTAPGAEGIIPLVSHSPLISWHFKLFGPYIGSDLIGLTEWSAAMLFIAGYLKPKAGIVGGLIATFMFFITSTMVMTTPDATVLVHGVRYMSFLGLFLFKDVISLGASLYLAGYFGRKAILSENKVDK